MSSVVAMGDELCRRASEANAASRKRQGTARSIFLQIAAMFLLAFAEAPLPDPAAEAQAQFKPAEESAASSTQARRSWASAHDFVRDLAREFHTRVELRQIGARDEAARIGGI